MYTPRFVADSSTGNPIQDLNQLMQETNDMYATSGVGITFRVAAYRQVNYTGTTGLSPMLDAMAEGEGVFKDINFQRMASGADLVVLVDGFNEGSDEVCGLAHGGGTATLGDFSDTSSRAVFAVNVELHLKMTHFPPRIASKIDPRITLPSRPFSGGFRSDKRGIIECNSTLASS